MQTIKTFVVFALLLAVCYGAFVALNAPDPELPPSFAEWQNSEDGLESLAELDLGGDIGDLGTTTAISADEMMQNLTSGASASDLGPGSTPMNPSPDWGTSAAGMMTSDSPSVEIPELSLPDSSSTPALSLNATETDASSLASKAGSEGTNPSNAVVQLPELSWPSDGDRNGIPTDSGLDTFPALEIPSSDGLAQTEQAIPPMPSFTGDAQATPGEAIENYASNLKNNLVNDVGAAAKNLNEQAEAAVNDLTKQFQQGMESQVEGLSSAVEDAGKLTSSSLIPNDMNLPGLAQPSVGTEESVASGDSLPEDSPLYKVLVERTTPPVAFQVAREQALAKAKRGELLDALRMLTPYFESPELGYAESIDLTDLLDALSREVIYSDRHLLEPPYTVRAGDTLELVAKSYDINPELLAAINALPPGNALVPKSQIKVVRGPFHGRVNMRREELTVFLGDIYAGRFPVSLGNDPRPKTGVFELVDRRTDRTYYGRNSLSVKPTDPRNPYGGYWMSLGNVMFIHGTAREIASELKDAGCISLAPLDAKHVYSILAKGSQVSIVH